MKNYIKVIYAIFLLLGVSTNAWGAKVSIKGSSYDTWTYTSNQIAITKSGVTLAAKGYSVGTVTTSEVRVNNGGSITISASQAITKVEFTVTSAPTFNQVDFDNVWTGSSTSIDFTAGSGQVIFTECKVTIGGYVMLHDFAGDRLVAAGGTLPDVRLGTLKGWDSSELWSAAEVDDGNYPAYADQFWPGDSAPNKDELWAVYQNSCDNSYSTEPTTVYHISSTSPASTSGGGTGYVKAYVNSEETYCSIPAGTTVEIRATAESDPFASWTVTKDGDASTVVTVASSTSATTTFTMPAYDVSLSAEFGGCTSQTVIVYDAGSNESKTCDYGSVTSFDVAYMSDGSGAVTWTSTNTNVATVVGKGGDAATVTIVGAGTTNIKATIAEDATYCVGEDVYPLTVNAVAPTVNNTNFSISSTTSTGATFVGGQVSAKGGASITTHGYVVGTASSVTWASGRVSEAGSNSDPGLNTNFTTMTTVTALSSGTTYYVRPFAYNGSQFGYGTAVSFTTPYAVSFDANGADDGDVPATRYIANGNTTTLPEQGTLSKAGYVFEGWAEGSPSGTVRAVGYTHTVNANITFYAKWRAVEYTDAKFSCADWTLTGPSGDIVFITSTASKTVRSQEQFRIQGNGLPHSTALTFTIFPASSKFVIKKADGTVPSTNEYGVVDAYVYVFYTPDAGDTDDGLDEFTSLTVSVTGEPRTATIDTKRVFGRHLPADFVIAAKRNGKWLALPSNMESTSTPSPVEIAVDDADNPSIAYTATANMYSLYDQSAGENIKLAMQGQNNAPLFGSASAAPIGKSGNASIGNTLGNGYLWKLEQKRATGLSTPQEAKYLVYSKNNSTNHLRLKENSGNPIWGLYDSGIEELRLIPASAATVVEAYAVEWGQHGMVVEVDAQGISATKVKAKLSGSETGLIPLSETKTSVKNRDTKYNYTVDFGVGFDLAASTALGKILMLEWYNSSDVMVGVTSIELPKIIATSATMSSIEKKKTEWAKWEVHILPNVTLEANLGSFSSGGAIRELHVYPGATLKVTTAGTARTITIDTLILRNGWTRAGSKRFDVARLYLQPYKDDSHKATNLTHTKAYLDWYIDYDQYYPMAVPWPVTVSNIKYKNSKIAASNITYYHYDGARRATYVQESQDDNWAQITPTTLEPSKGYAILAKRPNGKAFGIVRMPLTFTDTWTTLGEQGEVSGTHKDQVTVTAYGKGTTPWYAMGWNFIGNPYMATYNGDGDDSGITGKLIIQEGGSVKYATIPNLEFTDYDQLPVATADLKPGSPFFVQVGTGGTLEFSTSKIVPPSAPARYHVQQEHIPEQEAYIRLSNGEEKDLMGLIIGEDYTEAYEPDADLAKMLGSANAVKTYMRYNGDMAYVAINQTLAQEWIPVTVNIPAAGEYTYSLTNSSVVGQLEGVYLIDYATDIITNLIEQNYIFNATTAGTITNRFAINAIVGERQTPTPIDAVEQDHKNTNEPIKFIYRDKMYIMFNGVIYDATGKKVR